MIRAIELPRRISLYCKPVDMRMGQVGLLGVIRQETKQSPQVDVVYLFCNRSHSLIKGIFWDRTGYIVFSKRLEAGRYHLPTNKEQASLDAKSLRLFLDGLRIFL